MSISTGEIANNISSIGKIYSTFSPPIIHSRSCPNCLSEEILPRSERGWRGVETRQVVIPNPITGVLTGVPSLQQHPVVKVVGVVGATCMIQYSIIYFFYTEYAKFLRMV